LCENVFLTDCLSIMMYVNERWELSSIARRAMIVTNNMPENYIPQQSPYALGANSVHTALALAQPEGVGLAVAALQHYRMQPISWCWQRVNNLDQ
jgi:hypothetical protein